MQITLDKLKELGACNEAIEKWGKLELVNLTLEETIGKCRELDRLDWANWLIVRVITLKQRGMYAVYAAEQVLPIFEGEYHDDKRPRQAIEAAKKVIENDTEENRRSAYDAYDAAYDAYSAAYDAYAYAAAYDAYSAASAAYAAASDAAAWRKKRNEMRWKILQYGLKIIKEVK